MVNTSKNKIPNVPNLRFPEFTDEWKESELQDISKISKGSGISKDQLSENGTPCILYGELYTKYKSEIISEVLSKTEINEKNLVHSRKNDIIIPSSGETAIDISTARYIPFDDIFIGGDLNIIRLHDQDGRFFSYQLNGVRKLDIAKIAQGVSVVHLYGENLKKLKVKFPSIKEQNKISSLLTIIDERIVTQSKIIEDLGKLRSAIIEKSYNHKQPNQKIGDVIAQTSTRNRNGNNSPVLSVNNRRGFIEQSEQFEGRLVASEDTSNYKIVRRNEFAYNPARINVGSIARLISFKEGIVSPMYVCFKTKAEIQSEYLEHFFVTRHFYYEMQKRLEGSVRLCLSWEGLCDIPIFIPSIKEQKFIGKQIIVLSDKIASEKHYLELLKTQKQYLLNQLFI